jgi:hypothetical protein
VSRVRTANTVDISSSGNTNSAMIVPTVVRSAVPSQPNATPATSTMPTTKAKNPSGSGLA